MFLTENHRLINLAESLVPEYPTGDSERLLAKRPGEVSIGSRKNRQKLRDSFSVVSLLSNLIFIESSGGKLLILLVTMCCEAPLPAQRAQLMATLRERHNESLSRRAKLLEGIVFKRGGVGSELGGERSVGEALGGGTDSVARHEEEEGAAEKDDAVDKGQLEP